MAGRGVWREWWRTGRRPAAVIAVLGLVSGALGTVPAVDLAVVRPPLPAPVCPLLRAELLDLIVPGRVTLRDGTESVDPAEQYRVAWCEVSTSTRPADDAGAISLTTTVIAYGRKGWDGPRDLAEQDLAWAGRYTAERFTVPDLGDDAVYWIGRDGSVSVQARLGVRAVAAAYFNLGIPPQRRVEAAVLAAREVLARL